MPLSAMPEHLNTQEKIDAAFPDDSQYGTKTWYGRLYRWYQKKTKTWFAFSYRCTEWWAKTKRYPMVAFAIRGEGEWRWEGGNIDAIGGKRIVTTWRPRNTYLSRIQYYTRWHFAIQLTVWDKIPVVFPMVSFHWYKSSVDIPKYGESRQNVDGKLWFVYWGHFDADLVHWLVTSGYLGENWK
jgi:hypothetical protein